MNSHRMIYKCKRCSTLIKQRDLLLSHLHWHRIKDDDVDLYFVEVEVEVGDDASTLVAGDTHAREDRAPSLMVLIISLLVFAVMGIVYVVTS
jgi:hypothetical protein